MVDIILIESYKVQNLVTGITFLVKRSTFGITAPAERLAFGRGFTLAVLNRLVPVSPGNTFLGVFSRSIILKANSTSPSVQCSGTLELGSLAS